MTSTPDFKLLSIAALAALSNGLAQAAPAPLNADLQSWACVGQCGATEAQGDVTISPLGHASHGYVTTAGSTALNVSPLNLSESGGRGATFTQTNGSRYVSEAFAGQAGDTVSAYFNYVSTDGKGFDDYAWARLVNAADNSLVSWLFTARSSNSNKQSIVPGDLEVGFDPDATIVNYGDFEFQTRNLKTATPVNWALLGASNGACWRESAEGCGFTGWLQSQVTLGSAGNYRLEVGVVNFGDQAYDSGLAFDLANLRAPVSSVPEPQSAALALAAMLMLAGARLMKRRGTR